MTVKELVRDLNCYDPDMEVVMQATNSSYVDYIGYTGIKELGSFYGNDRDVLVIESGGQAGAV